MNDRWNHIPWKGLTVLLILLIIISIVAFVLSSLEGFAAGVIVIFIGWFISFFRDDIKRLLGISPAAEPMPPADDRDDSDEYIYKLEKEIAKRRSKIEKTVSKFESETKSYKRQKTAREIVEQATALVATIDRAKSYGIQIGHRDLVSHYDSIAQETLEIRRKFQESASEDSNRYN